MSRLLSPKLWTSLSYLLFFSYLILIILTFLDYGITYDEDWYSTYGEYIIQWYASGFQDDRALTFWKLPLDGGFPNVITRLASKLSPLGVFETSHLINAIFGLLGVVGAYKLGKLMAGPLAGFLSALFLVVTPRFYGHAFNNLKDIPMAALSIISIYYLIRLIHHLPHVPRWLLLKLGVVIGLAVAVRAGAIMLLGYVGIALCLWLLTQYLKARKPENQRGERVSGKVSGWVGKKVRERGSEYTLPRFPASSLSDPPAPYVHLKPVLFKLARIFLIICVIAYHVMLIWWPAAQARPFIQPARALWRTTHFEYPINIFFEGKVISNIDIPWYYMSKWFLITLPEFYFIALAVGLVLVGISVVQRRKGLYYGEQTLGILILLISAALPIAYTVLTNPTEYDGMRHFLFVVPPLAVIAGISVAKLVERVSFPFVSIAVIVAILASVAMTVVDMWQLHPHQYIFFNRLFGKGVAQAAKSYETDYWGNSYKEGVEWIVRNYKADGIHRRVKVASCLYSLSTSYFLPEDRFEYVGSYSSGRMISHDEQPDLLLATTRWNCHKILSGKVLHTITRKGAPLLYIIEVSHGSVPPG